MWRSRWRCVIKPAYSFSFLLSINIFVWQNVLYFLDAPRTYSSVHTVSCSIRAPWNLTEDRLAVPQSTQLVAAYLPRRPSFFLQTEVDVIKLAVGQGLARTVRCPCGANNFNINHLKNEVNRKYVWLFLTSWRTRKLHYRDGATSVVLDNDLYRLWETHGAH